MAFVKSNPILYNIPLLYSSCPRLNAYQVLTETTRNKDFYDLVTDSTGSLMTSLLNGFNTALITYGLAGISYGILLS